jgi:MFS transporter, YNFM family, putative membrane transport protein
MSAKGLVASIDTSETPSGVRPGTFTGALIMALASFFTLVDLFGPQAIVPVLTNAFATTPGRMGVVVNAATLRMAVTGIATACVADRIERKWAMIAALLLLAFPTMLVAFADNLYAFAALRMAQGSFMCVGFMVAIAYIAEEWGPCGAAPVVMSAYVTGNVAANMFGRLIAGAAAQYASWHVAFLAMAGLNLSGAVLLYAVLPHSRLDRRVASKPSIVTSMRLHLADPRLNAACLVGFLILFGFIGTFTYVNFRLSRPPFDLSPTVLGLLYTVFVVSLVATPAAGLTIKRFGHRLALLAGSGISVAGVIMTLSDKLPIVMTGLALVGGGTFFCQAVATGFTGHIANHAKGTASGLYLTAYYTGGIVGAFFLAAVYGFWGWSGCVAVIAGAFALMGAVAGLFWDLPAITAIVEPEVSEACS